MQNCLLPGLIARESLHSAQQNAQLTRQEALQAGIVLWLTQLYLSRQNLQDLPIISPCDVCLRVKPLQNRASDVHTFGAIGQKIL